MKRSTTAVIGLFFGTLISLVNQAIQFHGTQTLEMYLLMITTDILLVILFTFIIFITEP